MDSKNKNATPKISVIITCYNYGKFIDEAIQSIADQTFKDYEIIIIDDCSTDPFTRKKLSKLLECVQGYIYRSGTNQVVIESKISKLIQLKKNVGVCEARNLGVKMAKGEYIIFLDADDKFRKDCLQEMYDVIEKDEYDIISCLYETFGRESVKERKCKDILEHTVWMGYCSPTSLIKRKDFTKLNGFHPYFKKRGAEDFDFYMRLMNQGARPYIIQDHLFYYRKHDDFSSRCDPKPNISLKEKEEKQKTRLKIISNSPKIYLDYIGHLRQKIGSRERLVKRLLIIITILIGSHIFYLF